jgi:transcriptional regulator of arginine metabolism
VKGRQARLQAIRRLIQAKKIKSQDALLTCLQADGFALTQATLSRDLKTLEVGKASDGYGDYVYFLPSSGRRKDRPRTHAHIHDFLKGYISIEWSGNVVIVKTHSGHSDPVSVALDSFDINGVMGTISGRDNTVAVFLREGFHGEDFIKRLREIIPELD